MRFRNENEPLPEPITPDYSKEPFQIQAVDGDVVFYLNPPSDSGYMAAVDYRNYWEISFNKMSWTPYAPITRSDADLKITIPEGKTLYIRATTTNKFGINDTNQNYRWQPKFEGSGNFILKGQFSSVCYVDYLTPSAPKNAAKYSTINGAATFHQWFNTAKLVDVSDLYINFNSLTPTNGMGYSLAMGSFFHGSKITKGPHFTSLCDAGSIAPYISLYNGCTLLEEAELPMHKGTFASRAFESIFNGCTSLKKIIYRGTSAITSTFTNMYSSVPSGGVFYNLGGANVSAIPSGWTIKTTLD